MQGVGNVHGVVLMDLADIHDQGIGMRFEKLVHIPGHHLIDGRSDLFGDFGKGFHRLSAQVGRSASGVEDGGARYQDSFSCSRTTSPTMISVGGLGFSRRTVSTIVLSVAVKTLCLGVVPC